MMTSGVKQKCAKMLVESDAFDFEFLSELGQRESWRKELFRPIYHIHKWWANRLGSVFRGILLAAVLPEDADLRKEFYRWHSFASRRVLDPFMGSGTTLGEAHKLGFACFGQDINPVACETVRVAFGPLHPERLQDAFEQLDSDIGPRIRQLYTAKNEKDTSCDVLYYFWVKTVPCPYCGESTDLFPTRIIARHANPARRPEVQACCPACGDIFQIASADTPARCGRCQTTFSAGAGTARGAKATCSHCGQEFAIAKAVRTRECPPDHRLCAKLLLTPAGKKVYLPATEADERAYELCSEHLKEEIAAGRIRLPETFLAAGHNTKQAIGYNYTQWRQFFNDRQLLALGWLQAAIAELPDRSSRDVMMTLFSGLLEFNNLFASYKGEGTGAVRHMFSHHILKPERMPLEANVWGTPRSSGSFLNLVNTRLARAIEYRRHPFELNAVTGKKVFGASREFTGKVSVGFPSDISACDDSIHLSCGSSDLLSLPNACMDLVVTDPPFFDNVHYSELADFFYAWQILYPHGFVDGSPTTRRPQEVQDTDAGRFATKLASVLRECARVLTDDGLLIFSYHHSRPDGWFALHEALVAAGFEVVNAHPVRAEMTVATPKSQAKEPIQFDVIITCRKACRKHAPGFSPLQALDRAANRANKKIERLRAAGFTPSRNDCRVVFMGQLLSELEAAPSDQDKVALFKSLSAEIEGRLSSMAESGELHESRETTRVMSVIQMQLPFA